MERFVSIADSLDYFISLIVFGAFRKVLLYSSFILQFSNVLRDGRSKVFLVSGS